jgi:hypothetical protein
VTVVLTLALTIGATTAILSLGDAVLLRPLPFPESDRLVAIDTLQFPPGLHQLISTNLAAANNVGTSYPNFFDWQQQNKVQCFRRPDDLLPHCCSVAAMNFLAHVDAVIFRSARKWRGKPEDVRDEVSSYLFDKPTHLNDLYNRKEAFTTQDSGLCPMFPERWRINPHSC